MKVEVVGGGESESEWRFVWSGAGEEEEEEVLRWSSEVVFGGRGTDAWPTVQPLFRSAVGSPVQRCSPLDPETKKYFYLRLNQKKTDDAENRCRSVLRCDADGDDDDDDCNSPPGVHRWN